MTDNIKKADQLFFDADNKIKQNLLIEAKEMLEKAISINPKHGRSYNHLGWLYETKYQDYTKAEEYYKKALEYEPNYPAANINYAILLSTMEKDAELEKVLQKAEQVPGINKRDVYNEYGMMHEKKKEFDKAIKYYQKVLNVTYNNNDIQAFKDAIERCKMKKEMLAK